MKKLPKRLLFLTGFSFAIVTAFVSIIHAGNLPEFTIMTEEWEPYNYEENGIVKGISVDMLVLVLERIGSSQGRNDIFVFPWARAYHESLNKPDTILFTTTRTPERENLFKWVGPIFEIKFYLYALKSRHIKIDSPDDLKKYRIGTLRDDALEGMVVKKSGMKVDDFERVSQNIFNIKKLASGRVDLIAQSKETTISKCKEAGFDPELFEPVFFLEKSSMFYAFHKDTLDSIVATFQKAFDDLKSEGKLDEIYKAYGK